MHALQPVTGVRERHIVVALDELKREMVDPVCDLPEVTKVPVAMARHPRPSDRMSRRRGQCRRRDPLAIKTPRHAHLAMHAPRLRLLVEMKDQLVDDVERSASDHRRTTLRYWPGRRASSEADARTEQTTPRNASTTSSPTTQSAQTPSSPSQHIGRDRGRKDGAVTSGAKR